MLIHQEFYFPMIKQKINNPLILLISTLKTNNLMIFINIKSQMINLIFINNNKRYLQYVHLAVVFSHYNKKKLCKFRT